MLIKKYGPGGRTWQRSRRRASGWRMPKVVPRRGRAGRTCRAEGARKRRPPSLPPSKPPEAGRRRPPPREWQRRHGTPSAASRVRIAMRFDVLTLFPEMFSGLLGAKPVEAGDRAGPGRRAVAQHSRLGQATSTTAVDDRPFGGGPGMVLKVEPVVECVEAVQAQATDAGHLVMLTPQGRRLDQPMVEELAEQQAAGVVVRPVRGVRRAGAADFCSPTRFRSAITFCGAAKSPRWCVIDAVVRLVPGVLGDEESNATGFVFGRPSGCWSLRSTRGRANIEDLSVPEVLLSGDHAADRPVAERAELAHCGTATGRRRAG